ncbi:LOW QUALITY PROTEIN: RNA polymerase II mediator complex subunit [Podospora pseudoanserina]|uniref:Mediator of RNA polymerase II transcription subunit 10 n=1 Tax=Podospora pseudoanserina TaxID=2609844 RepID=A0ABR0HJB6_9PEZI|nr:LOW QUALITY PROTEIN: RNA polymerase II mediator complex subunit [Podospora pseudoanserina]
MAPVTSDLPQVQDSVSTTLTLLFQTLTNISLYDSAGRPSAPVLASDLTALDDSLLKVSRLANALPPSAVPGIPLPSWNTSKTGETPTSTPENSSSWRLNHLTRGKMHAFRDFRDVLAREMAAAMPEVKEDAMRVVEETGGKGPVLLGDEEGKTEGR